MTSGSSATTPALRGIAPLLAALSAVGPLTVDTYLPSMVEIARDLHSTPVAVQQTLTAYMVPFAIMTLWHGAISDALGRRAVILAFTSLYVLASVCCVFVRSIEGLILFRALQGATAGAGMVIGRAIVRDLYHGPEAQRLMSHVTLVFAIAPAVAPILGGWLHVWFGWRSVFVFLALFGAVACLLCRYALPETLPPEKRQKLHPAYLARSYRRVLTRPAFVAACLAVTLNFSGIFFYIVSAPVYVMQHLRLEETQFYWLFVPITAGMALGAWASSKMAGRVSHSRTFWIGYAVMASMAVANLALSSWTAPSLPWSVLPLLVYSFGSSLLFPVITLSALDLFPAQRGLAASCQSFVQTTGSAVVSVLAPWVWTTLPRMASAQLGVVCLAAIACVLHLKWKDARTHQDSPTEGLEAPVPSK